MLKLLKTVPIIRYNLNYLFLVRLSSTETFDAFMLQVRGRRRRINNDEDEDEDNEKDDGIFYAGSFTSVPGVAKTVKCGKKRRAAVVDKGDPKYIKVLIE